MSDRKVLTKYYPVDFDPSKIPKISRPKNSQTKVRIALPMSIHCLNCKNYMARGTKFNARKENVPEEVYLGIMVYRFYFRCSKCFSEMTIKTDPRNSDYLCEKSCIRGFELHKDDAKMEKEKIQEQEKFETMDVMSNLEKLSRESRREVLVSQQQDRLEWINKQRAAMNSEEITNLIIDLLNQRNEEESAWTEEELKEIENAKFKYKILVEDGKITKRISDEQDEKEQRWWLQSAKRSKLDVEDKNLQVNLVDSRETVQPQMSINLHGNASVKIVPKAQTRERLALVSVSNYERDGDDYE